MQSLCLDIAYLSFQTIFFERFIAAFKIKGNVGFFIITIYFIGYAGTVILLLFKEFYASHINWALFYNQMSVYIGITCCIAFIASMIYILKEKNRKTTYNNDLNLENNINNNVYLTTTTL